MSTRTSTASASVLPSPTSSVTRTSSLSPSGLIAAAAASSTSDDITLPIIYAVIGATAGLVILICLVYCIVRWRASNNKPPPAKQPPAAAVPPPPVAAAHVQVNIDGDPSPAQQKRGSSASQRLPRPSAAGMPPLPPRASIAAMPDRGRISLGTSPHTPVESSPLRTLIRPQSAAAMSPRDPQFGGGSPPMLRTHSASSMRATSPLPPGSTGGDPLLAVSPLRQQQQQGALSASPSQRGLVDGMGGVSPPGSGQRLLASPTGAAAATRSPLLGMTPLSAGSGGAGQQQQQQQQQQLQQQGASPLSARYAAQTLGRRRLQAQTAASPRRDSPLIDEEPPSHPALHHKLSEGALLPLQGGGGQGGQGGRAFVYPPTSGGYGTSPPGPGAASARSPVSGNRSTAGGAAGATTPVAAGPAPLPPSSVAYLRGHLDLDDSPGALAATWRKHQSL